MSLLSLVDEHLDFLERLLDHLLVLGNLLFGFFLRLGLFFGLLSSFNYLFKCSHLDSISNQRGPEVPLRELVSSLGLRVDCLLHLRHLGLQLNKMAIIHFGKMFLRFTHQLVLPCAQQSKFELVFILDLEQLLLGLFDLVFNVDALSVTGLVQLEPNFSHLLLPNLPQVLL